LVKNFAQNDLLQTVNKSFADSRENELEELGNFHEKILSILDKNGSFDVQNFLAGEHLTHEMVNNGLSSNKSLQTNVSSVLWSQRTVLLVDPSDAILTFLRTSRLPEAINVSTKDKSLFQKLTVSLRLGKILILEDFTADFPTFLAPVIQKTFNRRQNEVWEVEMGGKSFHVSPQFRLIVHNRFSEDLDPTLLQSFDVIDNSYKRQTLETHFVDFILGIQNPEVLGKRLENLQVQKVANSELKQLEADILEKVKTIDETLLENESLIRSLQITKSKSQEVEKNLEELKKIGETLAEKEKKYSKIGAFLSQIFLFLEKLPKINPIYRFSLAHFCHVAQKSLAKSCEMGTERRETDQDLLTAFVGEFCIGLFREICTAFKAEDRVFLSLVLLIADGRMGVTDADGLLILKLMKETAAPIHKVKGTAGGDNPIKRLTQQTVRELEACHKGLIQKVEEDIGQVASVLRAPNLDKNALIALQKKFSKREILIVLAIFEPKWFPYAIQEFFEGRFGKLWENSSNQMSQLKTHLAGGEGHVIINCLGGADPTAELTSTLKGSGLGPNSEDIICSEDSHSQAILRIQSSPAALIVLKNFGLCPRLAEDLLPLTSQAKKAGRILKFVLITEDVSMLSKNFLAQSFKMTFEKTDRLSEIMRKSYDVLPITVWEQMGIEKANLLFSSCHLHAQFCLRERQASHKGWAKAYEFGWLEFSNAAQFFGDLQADRSDDCLRIYQQMLINCLYGSKIDDLDDRAVLVDSVLGTIRLEHSRSNILPNSTDVRIHHGLFDQLEKAWEAKFLGDKCPANSGFGRLQKDALAKGLEFILTK
jgi:hypothetical protein